MGTQGSCSHAIARKEAVGQGRGVRFTYIRGVRFTYIMSSLLLWPALAACSSFASLSPGPNQSAAVSPPASPAVAAAQPGSMAPAPGAHDSAASISPYPKQSLVDLFREDSAPTPTANVPHPPNSYTPSGQPYVPPSGQQNYGAPAGAAPAAPAAQPAAAAPPPANTGPYPSQSLFDIFSNKSTSQ